jgi:glucan 1,3-beta-glucosidase
MNDPTFSSCAGQPANCYDAWGLRIVNSQNILIYGAGHYSFFNNFNTSKYHLSVQMIPLEIEGWESLETVLTVEIACNIGNGPENCQLNIVNLEGTLTQVNIYCLSTIGTINMISEAGNTVAKFSDNVNVFPDLIALFQLASGTGGVGTYILRSFIYRIWHSDSVPLNYPPNMITV